MRVIITGQPGTCKKRLALLLANYIPEISCGHAQDANPQSSTWEYRRTIRIYEVESNEWLGIDYLNFLTNFHEYDQSQAWGRSLQRINEDIASSQPEHILLLIHSTFYRDGRFFSPTSWDDLLLFKPDCIITLIDDIHDVWQRIEQGPYETHLNLDDILVWRSVEVFYSSSLSRNLLLNPEKLSVRRIPRKLEQYFSKAAIPHFVMSIKHPMETFHRLIFERPDRKLVYASFPISRTRESTLRRDDINSFRQGLHETGSIVIDPLTIDELRLDPNDDPEWLKLKNDASFRDYQEKRWRIDNPAISPPEPTENPFSNLSDEQILRIRRGIVQQLVDRDFRLITQAEKLIAYRPFYPVQGDGPIGPPTSAPTDGVVREITYALDLGRECWAFHPKCDQHQEQESNFFSNFAVWHRVRQYPSRGQLNKALPNVVAGLDELLTELAKENPQTREAIASPDVRLHKLPTNNPPVKISRLLKGRDKWIEDRVQAFAAYDGGDGFIDHERISRFLSQFASIEDIEAIKPLLDHFRVWTSEEVIDVFKSLLGSLVNESRGKRIHFVPLGGVGDSSSKLSFDLRVLCPQYPEINYAHLREALDSTISYGGDASENVFVFYEDVLATGKQSKTVLDQYFGNIGESDEEHVPPLTAQQQDVLRLAQKFFLYVLTSELGVKNLVDKCDKLKLAVERAHIKTFSDMKGCFDPAAGIFPGTARKVRNRAKEICQEIGFQLLADKTEWDEAKRRKYALGYGGLQQVVAFYYNTPTCTLPMFWAEGKVTWRRSTLDWLPLFKRRRGVKNPRHP